MNEPGIPKLQLILVIIVTLGAFSFAVWRVTNPPGLDEAVLPVVQPTQTPTNAPAVPEAADETENENDDSGRGRGRGRSGENRTDDD